MKLTNLPPEAINWAAVPVTDQPGASGHTAMRVFQAGDLRLRMVDYSAGYLADHWCHKGHIIHVLAGQLIVEHENGSEFVLDAGMTYHVADEEGSPHRARSNPGATVFIVD
ncbi:MAG: DHCW motif cupin fold protein [Bryobacterales bacterium]|nr:DHCW motif cupin fold protein [Bryobacterales bacterium]